MISIQFQYSSLFEVSFEHEYFEDNILRSFDIVAEGDTLSFVHDLGMLFKKTENGFRILLDNINTESLIMKFEKIKKENVKLRFLLNIKDPFFKNYSDVSLNTMDRMYLLSNINLKDEKKGLLHKKDFLSEENLFTLEQDTLENSPEIKVPILNKGVPIALIELELNEQLVSKVLDKLLDDEIEKFSYRVRIASRSVKWRYIIKAEASKKAEGLSINTEEGSVKFSKGENTTYKNSDVVIFEADSDMKFQEHYRESFQLKRKNGISGAKVLRRRLPSAPLETLSADKVNKGKYYSDILVYI